MQIRELLSACHNCVVALIAAGAAAARSAGCAAREPGGESAQQGPEPVPPPLSEGLQAALQTLVTVEALWQGNFNSAAAPSFEQLLVALREFQGVEKAAAKLADLLLQFQTLPAQAAEIRLELAQAAATRSCAYLGCSNLVLEGGPAAGEGVGSKKCAACRSVWYCGTNCSHADWRAGHRRVCKVLAAARQQTRQHTAAVE